MYMYRNSNSHLLRQYDVIKTNLNVKERFQMVTFFVLPKLNVDDIAFTPQ